MNGSERTRLAAAWANAVREVLRGRMRFAGLAYLATTAMILTLLAGAFISSQASSGGEAAAVAEPQASPVVLPAVVAEGQDAALLTTNPEALSDVVAPTPSPSPEAQPQASEPVPVHGRGARKPPVSPAPPAPDSLKAQLAATPTIQITDSGFVPDQVTVKAGDAIQWVNDGTKVHTATALTGAPRFDTGGLASHQTAKVAFSAPGTYVYSSATDCLNGNHDPGFTCGKYFAVTVTD